MNFESLEQFRYESTKKVMEAMSSIACDPKATIEERLKAAKVVDGMSDSIIHAYIILQSQGDAGKAINKLTNQLGKLNDNKNEY